MSKFYSFFAVLLLVSTSVNAQISGDLIRDLSESPVFEQAPPVLTEDVLTSPSKGAVPLCQARALVWPEDQQSAFLSNLTISSKSLAGDDVVLPQTDVLLTTDRLAGALRQKVSLNVRAPNGSTISMAWTPIRNPLLPESEPAVQLTFKDECTGDTLQTGEFYPENVYSRFPGGSPLIESATILLRIE